MKTRSGFVSNSSSSSFVVEAKGKHKSVFDLAMELIPMREWDDDKEMVDRLVKLVDGGMNPDTPLTFKSCNYDTFIMKVKGKDGKEYLATQTCNNHSFYSIGGLVGADEIAPALKKLADAHPREDGPGKGQSTWYEDDDPRDWMEFFLETVSNWWSLEDGKWLHEEQEEATEGRKS